MLFFLQNGYTQVTQTQDFLMREVQDSMTHKNKLLTKAQELEAQVKSLEKKPSLTPTTNILTQGTSTNISQQQQRKRKLESENLEPKLKDSKKVSSAEITSALTDHQDYMKGNIGMNEPRNRMFGSETSVLKGQLMENQSNLSIRKLLENTRPDKTSVSTESTVKDFNLKQNGLVKLPMALKPTSDLNPPKPSLPISIPLECLPGENVKDAMDRVILHGLKLKSNSRNSSASPVPRPNSRGSNTDSSNISRPSSRSISTDNTDNKDSANKDNLGHVNRSEQSASRREPVQLQSSWTSANFIPNDGTVSQNKTSFAIDKLVLNKKKGHIFNGERKLGDNASNDNSANVQAGQKIQGTSQDSINTSNTLNLSVSAGNQFKRKHDGGEDTASKRLFGLPSYGTSSPQTQQGTDMLISTANQPLQISAIPSPDVQGKLNSLMKQESKSTNRPMT